MCVYGNQVTQQMCNAFVWTSGRSKGMDVTLM